jgi:uncharacterized protein (TIGR02421 family)
MKRGAKTAFIDAELVSAIVQRLESGQPVRRTLSGGGRLHVDRPLPFLVVYRAPSDQDDGGTRRLILGQPAYLALPAKMDTEAMRSFVSSLVKPLSRSLGAYLIVEIWSAPEADQESEAGALPPIFERGPRFRVVTPDPQGDISATKTLIAELQRVTLDGPAAIVEHVDAKSAAPPGLPPLLDADRANQLDCYIVGIEIEPVYRDSTTGALYPNVVREIARQLGDALRHAFFRFAHEKTESRPETHLGLGRRAVVKAVHAVDEELAAISGAYDFLLAVTPVNATEEWETFSENGHKDEPNFRYRRLTHDPEILLRRLYAVPLENMEDPTLERIFREKVREVARQLTMLAERNTHRFLFGSLQLYGEVEDDLLRLAEGILAGVTEDEGDEDRSVGATEFAQLARNFLDDLRASYDELKASVEVRADMSSLMVSKGRLLVPSELRVSPARALALAHHEAGTHVLTWANGSAQPLALLHTGLAGYEALQEGLAVLSEFLVGGLNRSRLRLLAGRVVAAARVIDGAPFTAIFDELTTTHGLTPRTAFSTTMRAMRSGGLTKDVVYLRGLKSLLDYLSGDGNLEILFLGKMALRHVPLVQELRAREVLRPAPLRPPCLDVPGAQDKLAWLREGRTVLDLPETTIS